MIENFVDLKTNIENFMKTKTLLALFAVLMLSACGSETEKITGHAVIVDNFKDKNPLEGVYIEVEYTNNEGYSYEFLNGATTDNNGYFKIDTKFETDFFGIDSWAYANVYSDKEYSDTLGSFRFQYPDKTYSYKTIHLDTFTLSHNVWIIPKIGDLGGFMPDGLSIDFYNCELVDSSKKDFIYTGAVKENQTFAPVEIEMTMNTQHWLSYGTGDLARGSLKKDSKEIAFGYFKLAQTKRTTEGDTLYVIFNVDKTK